MMKMEDITKVIARAVDQAIAEVGLARFKQTSMFMSSQRKEQLPRAA